MVRIPGLVDRFQNEDRGTLCAKPDLDAAMDAAMGAVTKAIGELARETAGLVEAAAETAETAQTTAETAQTTAETAQTTAETAQTTAETAQTTAETAQTTAETAQTTAETAQTTADGKVDAAYVDNAVAGARLSVQTWLAAVPVKAQLPDPSGLSGGTSYLCRVINDTGAPANNGVWQLVPEADEWTYFSNNADFVDVAEMETAIAAAVSEAAEEEQTARDTAIAEKVDSLSTGTVTEDTNKFPASTVIPFASFFNAVVSKINGIITALAGKQDALESGKSIKTVDGKPLLGSGNIETSAVAPVSVAVSDLVAANSDYAATGNVYKIGKLVVLNLTVKASAASKSLSANTAYDLFTFKSGYSPNINGLNFAISLRNSNTVAAMAYTNMDSTGTFVRFKAAAAITLNDQTDIRLSAVYVAAA